MREGKFLRRLVTAAMFSALVLVMTFFIKIPMPSRGYIHLGDSVIYLAACFLPTPFAILSAGIGGALADVFGGYAQYALPTLIIKMLIALPFSNKDNKRLLTRRNAFMVVPAAAITIAGYYLTSVIMFALDKATAQGGFFGGLANPSTWIASLVTIPENSIQAGASAIVFLIAAAAFDKASFKVRMSALTLGEN